MRRAGDLAPFERLRIERIMEMPGRELRPAMVPGKANQRVIADRLDWVQRMTDEIRALPLESLAVCHLRPGDCGSAGSERCLRELAEEAPEMYRYHPVNPVQLNFYPCHRIIFNLNLLFNPAPCTVSRTEFLT